MVARARAAQAGAGKAVAVATTAVAARRAQPAAARRTRLRRSRRSSPPSWRASTGTWALIPTPRRAAATAPKATGPGATHAARAAARGVVPDEPGAAGSGPGVDGSGIRAVSLDGGLTLVTEAMDNVASVSLGFWVGTGGRDEDSRRSGHRPGRGRRGGRDERLHGQGVHGLLREAAVL